MRQRRLFDIALLVVTVLGLGPRLLVWGQSEATSGGMVTAKQKAILVWRAMKAR